MHINCYYGISVGIATINQSLEIEAISLYLRDAKLKEILEELEKEKIKVEECRKKTENETRMMREEMEKEKRMMIEEMREKKEKLDILEEAREKMDNETEEEMRRIKNISSDLEVKLMEIEG